MTVPSEPSPLSRRVEIARFRAGSSESASDLVAQEAPLQIRIGGKTLAVVMRTPGDDLDLVRGLLLTEGIVADPKDVVAIAHCRTVPAGAPDDARENVVLVQLRAGLTFRPQRFRRNLVASSSCGVCGRATIDALAQRTPCVVSDLAVAPRLLLELPSFLRAAQAGFSATGGLHAAALFSIRAGRPRLLVLREDVGRHNAVDKVIGAASRHSLLPLSRCILQVSGRVSYEIVQKARVAGIPIVSAVSAPSSLAVELAEAGGQTLIAFVRDDRFNVYSGRQRVEGCSEAAPSPADPRSSRAVTPSSAPRRHGPRLRSKGRRTARRGGAS
jgi:FdhD protein